MASGMEWYRAMKEEARKDALMDATIGVSFQMDVGLHRRLRLAAAEVGLSMRDFLDALLDTTLPMFDMKGED